MASPRGRETEALQAWLDDVAPRAALPAAAVVLVSADGSTRSAHHGRLAGPNSPLLGEHSLFRWYSLTKPVTATMVSALLQQGLLTLATKASAVLPDLAPHLGDATVEDLLSHRAGFRDWQLDAARWFRAPQTDWPTPREALARVLGSRERHRARGDRAAGPSRYSNLGYAVLGEVAAEAAGLPYRQLVSELVLRPLGMDGTGFAMDRCPGASTEAGPSPPAAAPVEGHVRLFSSMGVALRLYPGGGFLGPRAGRLRRTRPREIIFSPHGGLVGPADDLAPFLALHLGHRDHRGADVLSEGALRDMQRPRGARAGSPRPAMGDGSTAEEATGLGWILGRFSAQGHDVEICRHGGRGPGFSTEMMCVPEWGLAAAVLTNVDGDAQGLCRALLARGPASLQPLLTGAR